MKKRLALIFTLIAIFLWLSPIAEAQNRFEVFEKTFAASGAAPVRVTFRDVDGDLRILPSPTPDVRVKVRKEVPDKFVKDVDRILKETEVRIEENRDSIRIEIHYPRRRGLFSWLHDFRRVRVSTELFLPDNARLEARMSDGDIRGEGVAGTMELHTSDGDIRLVDCRGDLRISTSDGDLTLKDVQGDVEAVSSDGDIKISGGLSRLLAKTSDGNISIVAAKGSAMAGDWEIRSSDGDIEVSLPPDFSADVAIDTSDGRITSRLPLSVSQANSQRKLSGRLGNGGRAVAIHTSDGNISIQTSIEAPFPKNS